MESFDKKRKYRAVANELRDNILSGKYAPGAAFPSVKMLCRRFSVSHLTAVKAIETLKGMGLVRARNGVGTFVRRRMTSIGLIVPMLGQVEIFPPICHEISHICQEKGIAVDFADISGYVPKMVGDMVVATARRMAGSEVSGVIIHPVDFGDGADKVNCEVEEIFHTAGIPVVLLDSDIDSRSPDRRFDFVGIDNRAIGRNVGMHVIECGAKSIAFVAWENMTGNVMLRLDGVMSAIASQRGVKLAGKYLWMRDEHKLAQLWCRRLPDAIVCASDLVAAHVLKLLMKLKKHCPHDVLVTGVNDVDLATLVSPPLTTIHQPCEAIARAAFEMLLWRMENQFDPPRRIFVSADLVVRESTTRHQ